MVGHLVKGKNISYENAIIISYDYEDHYHGIMIV